VAAAEIISHHEWKTATYPLQFDPIKDILNLGVIYGYKRDICFRPVIVVNCQKILQNAVSKKVLNHFLEQHRKASQCYKLFLRSCH